MLKLGHPRARPAAGGELSARTSVLNPSQEEVKHFQLWRQEGEKQSGRRHRLLTNHRIRTGIELESLFRLFPPPPPFAGHLNHFGRIIYSLSVKFPEKDLLRMCVEV